MQCANLAKRESRLNISCEHIRCEAYRAVSRLRQRPEGTVVQEDISIWYTFWSGLKGKPEGKPPFRAVFYCEAWHFFGEWPGAIVDKNGKWWPPPGWLRGVPSSVSPEPGPRGLGAKAPKLCAGKDAFCCLCICFFVFVCLLSFPTSNFTRMEVRKANRPEKGPPTLKEVSYTYFTLFPTKETCF